MTPPSPLGDRSASSANATELDPIELGLDIATELMRGGAAANEYLEAILDDGETECTRAARAAGEGEKAPPSVPIITAPRRRTPGQRERDAECRRQRRAKEECKEAELEEQRAMYQIKYVSKACDQISASATVLLDAADSGEEERTARHFAQRCANSISVELEAVQCVECRRVRSSSIQGLGLGLGMASCLLA